MYFFSNVNGVEENVSGAPSVLAGTISSVLSLTFSASAIFVLCVNFNTQKGVGVLHVPLAETIKELDNFILKGVDL